MSEQLLIFSLSQVDSPKTKRYNSGMKPQIAQKLVSLNHQFYQTFSSEFSDTRMRIQPGVRKVVETLPPNAKILDVGCGNGELARVLASNQYDGLYIGTDFSANLLKIACQGLPENFSASFYPLNLITPNWDQVLPSFQFDFVFAFATMHHIPSRKLQKDIFTKIHHQLKPNGKFIHSYWQFLNSPRLKKRILSWEEIGLSSNDVDAGDYLLDWRRGGKGIRYVHHFSEDELHSLASEAGFSVVNSFYSDGKERNLGLYQIWVAR